MNRGARLTPKLLAEHRPGALVAVVIGHAAGVPKRRPRGHALVARAQVGAVASASNKPPAPSEQVAVVSIRGVLEQRASEWSCGETCGYDTIEDDISTALADPGVGSLVIACDSPGGDVPGLEETTKRIRMVADGIGKPVIGYVDELVASAALYLMVGVCDEIYLPPSGMMGAISSCIVFQTEARALVEHGIDTYVARGLPGKFNPNSVEPLDELGKSRLDKIAIECSERFVAFVSAQRGVSVDDVRKWNAGVFTGAECVGVGLADGVGSLDETITLAALRASASTQEAA